MQIHDTTAKEVLDDWSRAKIACKRLEVSTPTLFRWRRIGHIQHRKVGGATYYNCGQFFRDMADQDESKTLKN